MENKCEECGADVDELVCTTKERSRSGEDYWNCNDCFEKRHGMTFYEYGTGD